MDVVGIQWKFLSFSFSSRDFPLENHGITGKGNYLTELKGQSSDKGVLCQGVGDGKDENYTWVEPSPMQK